MRFYAMRFYVVGMVVVGSIGWPAPAEADPITFDVHITKRFTVGSPPEGEPFEQRFTLLMAFNPPIGGPGDINPYGVPTFSDIPPSVPPPPPGLATTTQPGFAQHKLYDFPGNEDIPSIAAFAAGHYEFGRNEIRRNETLTYDRYFTIGGRVVPPPTTVLSLENFPEHLIRSEDDCRFSWMAVPCEVNGANFQYQAVIQRDRAGVIETLEAVGYSGFLTVRQDEAPIPEPATIALVGAGLAMLARRHSKRRAQQRLPL